MTTATETRPAETTQAASPPADEHIEIPCAKCGQVNCGGHNEVPADPEPAVEAEGELSAALRADDVRGLESYRCEDAQHLVTATIRRVSPNAFELVSFAGTGDPETPFHISADGGPVCPTCAKPMPRWTPEVADAREAIAAAQEQVNDAGERAGISEQPLPFPPPPFDPDRALRKIEALNEEYGHAIDDHEEAKKAASEAREHREEVGLQLRNLISDFRKQRAEAKDHATRPALPFDADQAERDRQTMLAADAAQQATTDQATDVVADPPADGPKEPARRLPKRHAAQKPKPASRSQEKRHAAMAADKGGKRQRKPPERAPTPSELDREASRVRERRNRNARKSRRR